MENGLNQNDQNGSISESGSPDGSLSQSQDSSVQDWRETLPAELKSEKSLERFKDVSEVAKSWIEAQKVISQKGVIVPTEKSSPGEWNNYYKSLGRPDTPDGYGLQKPELPEGMIYDENRTKSFAEIAHKEGLTSKQLATLHTAWNDMAKSDYENSLKSVNEMREKTTVELKKEWGSEFESNLAQADSAIDKVFGAEFKQMLVETGLNQHPAVIKGMFKASQTISEHSLSRGEGTVKGTFSREGLNSLMLDKRYSGDRSQRDEKYVKEIEQYAADLTAQLGA